MSDIGNPEHPEATTVQGAWPEARPESGHYPEMPPAPDVEPRDLEAAAVPLPAIPVVPIPPDDWHADSMGLDLGTTFQLLAADPHRRRAVLVLTGAGAVRIGPRRDLVANGAGYLLDPGDPPIELGHRGDVWVYVVADTALSYFAEYDYDRPEV